MSERNEAVKSAAAEAIADADKLAKLIETLSSNARRERQLAASVIHEIARTEAEKLADSIDELLPALECKEAQTRWEVLEALTLLVESDARACSKAIPEAETALFDEDNGIVRLAAMRFLCKIGATTTNRSEKVWPLIDEGIQCYHGDLEFNDMLTAIAEFATGKLADSVKQELEERMKFDAENGKGTLKKRAAQIIDSLK